MHKDAFYTIITKEGTEKNHLQKKNVTKKREENDFLLIER
jgi:hypothetical protein